MMRSMTALFTVCAVGASAGRHGASQSGGGDVREAASGGSCGPSAGNAVCAAGLCCSAAGICGTGAAFCSAPDCQLSFGPACDGNQAPTGSDTSKVPRPVLGNVPYGVSISHCTVNGKVALTFDDGPYIYTSELLDTLKRNSVKATFFVVGNNGAKGHIELASTGYPAILQRMYADGHQIGSHSWSHQDLGKVTAQQRQDQILKNEVALVDILGFIPTYFRPPYTSCPDDCLKDLGDLGYHVANYDIDTRDWQGDYTPGSSSWISLAHDIQPNTVHSFAQYMIDQAHHLGYELVPLGQCLGDPEANWYRDPVSGQAWTGKSQQQSSSSSGAQSSAPATVAMQSPVAAHASPASTSSGASPLTLLTSQALSMSVTLSLVSTLLVTATSDPTVPTPTPAAVGGAFAAGTDNDTSSSASSTIAANATLEPAASGAVDLSSSAFGFVLGFSALLWLY
ncbi:hypothetical protein JX265_003624 [Neoarthrinium moseri]|uniref:Chitin deacetylase n=1 Tax=Neoarthrinium moseri TaxID=1658444 RepID=A0A9P9WSA5_9PEZI|nr:hypothetical protein JX265_003624 [Neoarthrinium moseri]